MSFSIDQMAKVRIERKRINEFLAKLSAEHLLTDWQHFDWLYVEYLCAHNFDELWYTRYINAVKMLPDKFKAEAQDIFGITVK